jgi:hypothetical protein
MLRWCGLRLRRIWALLRGFVVASRRRLTRTLMMVMAMFSRRCSLLTSHGI